MANNLEAKPFLKWAGGKTQLLPELSARLPARIKKSRTIDSYVEPFLGSGAFFFHLYNTYQINEAYLFDINKELILTYRVVQAKPQALIVRLKELEETYLKFTPEGRKDYFYKIRALYNKQMLEMDYHNFSDAWIERAAYMIFLNKTCFNGLFRQNRKGEFNVPHGRYKRPTICDAANLRNVSNALARVTLICGDFEQADPYIRSQSLVYFDPPYRPLSATANFTSYVKEDFADGDQERLADFYTQLHKRGAYLMLSNSDPRASNPDDNFFDHLYGEFSIDRVLARRNINRDGAGRGKISELIIKNY